jgi:PPM family protein phosphatase
MPDARAPHPTLVIQAAGAADIGRVRSHNEDAVLVRPDLRLYIVADGAGGHNAGNVASALAVASITNHFESTERAYRAAPEVDRFGVLAGERRLSSAIRKANHDVVEISKSAKKYGGMGSTIVAATVAVRAPTFHVAHVGDSRCYRLRSGRLEQLTHDHSLINEVIELHPDLGDETLAKLPRRVVTRALGMEESVRVTVRSFEIAPEDVYLLCSDGLTGELTDEQIRRVLTLPESPAELVEHLVRLANAAGGGDNIAAVVLAFGENSEITMGGPESPPKPPGDSRGSEITAVELPQANAASEPAAPPPPPPPRPAFVSAPEILLLGIESDVDPEEAPALRIVPSSSASSGLIDALGDLLQTRRQRGALVACAACGDPVLTEAEFCPHCGAARVEG